MTTFEQDMYDQRDTNADEKKLSTARITNQGKIKLVEINGETISIVDPQLVAQLETMIKRLQHQVDLLEHQLRQTRAKQTNFDKRLSATARVLDNKVSYE